MFVPIPGLGVVRSAEGGNLRFEPELNLGGTSFGPRDVLPSGQTAALAVWIAMLKGEGLHDEEQAEALARFISEGL